MEIFAGINGFGRFGLHLLRYWLNSTDESFFEIRYINDAVLSAKKILEILLHDRYVTFGDHQISLEGNTFVFRGRDSGRAHHIIEYTNTPPDSIPWLGRPDLFFECSGALDPNFMRKNFLKKKTKIVLISATALDSDATLIYGFNHELFEPEVHHLISYGSCTVNAYVPLAYFVDKLYEVHSSDVHIIHNTPEYKLANERNRHLIRKECTLSKSAPGLLPFLNKNNFHVGYTNVPYSGVSSIDIRFQVAKLPAEFLTYLKSECATGIFQELYSLDTEDRTSAHYKFNATSAILIEPNIKILDQNIYLHGYFDNENSVTRYFDLASYIARVIYERTKA